MCNGIELDRRRANELEDVGRRAGDDGRGAQALEPDGAAPGGNGEDTRRRAGARAGRRFGDEDRGLRIGGQDEQLGLGALGIEALERRLDELRNCSRVMRQDVQYVLIAGDSRSLTLFQVLLHQTPDFQWPATRRRGKVYQAAHSHSSRQSYAVTETTTQRAFAPSANVAFLKESATIAVSARARALKAQGRKVIDLGAGRAGFRHAGVHPPRRTARNRRGRHEVHGDRGDHAAPRDRSRRRRARAGAATGSPHSDVVVSNGSKQSLFNACFTLFGEGDEVLIPTPSWTSYYEMVALSRAKPVSVIGDPENGLKVTAAFLDAASTPRTKGVMLNSPCNPTGAVYTESELREILELADNRDWWVLSDEIYRRISYNGSVGVGARSVDEARPAHRDRWRGEGVRDDGVAHWVDGRAAGP